MAAAAVMLPLVVVAAPADTDGDGLSDQLEMSFQTDVFKSDTDGDGFLDGHEVANGYSPTTAAPVKLTKELVIEVGRNRIARYLGGVKLDEFPISPGKPRTPTPQGEFTVVKKYPRAWSRRFALWMPWWMNFSGPGAPTGLYGIHELPYWPDGRREGASYLGRAVSNGCVRLGIGPAKELYDWTPEGTRVIVRNVKPIAQE